MVRPLLFCFADESPEQLQRIGSKRLGNGEEFYDVQTTFAAFVLGDKRLRFPKFFGERLLTDASLVSRCNEQADETGILGGLEGLFHWPPGALIRRRSI